MSEVFGMLGLEALTGLLLGLGWILLGSAWTSRRYAWRRWKTCLWAGAALCFTWANFILGSVLVPRYVHGSALHPDAGQAPNGAYYIVDQFERRNKVSAAGFRQRQVYEECSRWLPWGVTPAALLVLILWYPRGRDRYQSIRLRASGDRLVQEYE
jgi:hypothetical protein